MAENEELLDPDVFIAGKLSDSFENDDVNILMEILSLNDLNRGKIKLDLGKVLFASVCYKAFTCLEFLLKEKVHPDSYVHRRNERTAFMLACYYGEKNILKTLMDHGANVNHVDVDGQTALMICVKNGFFDCAKLLVDNNADVNLTTQNTGANALIVAACYDNLPCLKLLLNAGTPIDFVAGGLELTAAMFAAQTGSFLCFKELAEHGADLSVKRAEKDTALSLAVQEGSYDIAKYILDLHDEQNIENKREHDLLKAALGSHKKTAPSMDRVLAEIGVHSIGVLADIQYFSLDLMTCVTNRNAEALEFILKYNHIKQKDMGRHHWLMTQAVSKDTPECINVLSKYGFEITTEHMFQAANCNSIHCLRHFLEGQLIRANTQDSENNTLLHCVICEGVGGHNKIRPKAIECVELLLSHGAEVNLKNDSGKTLAMLVAMHNGGDVSVLLSIMKLLIKAGADLNAQDEDGDTALICLFDHEFIGCHEKFEMTQLLVDSGAHIDICNEEGSTALMMAAWIRWSQCCKLLIERGANVWIKNNKGETLFDMCVDSVSKSYNESNKKDYMTDNLRTFRLLNVIFTSMPHSIECEAFLGRFFEYIKTWEWDLQRYCERYTNDYAFIGFFLQNMLRWKEKMPSVTMQCSENFAKLALFCRPNIIKCLIQNAVFPISETFLFQYDQVINDYNKRCQESRLIVNTRQYTWNDGIIRYLLVNGFFSSQDIQNFALKEFKSLGSLEDTDKKSCKIFEKMTSQPWPLVKLCLLTVHKSFDNKEEIKSYARCPGLPPKLQRFLLHENDSARICPSQWDNIPIVTDPLEYDNLARHRPLIDIWPVGRDLYLEKCGCLRCGPRGLRFHGVETTNLDITDSLFPHLNYGSGYYSPHKDNFYHRLEVDDQDFALLKVYYKRIGYWESKFY